MCMKNPKEFYDCLGREDVYKASSRVWSFRKADDIVNGINLRLSNMFGGFPFECSGIRWTDSERLYLCAEFGYNTEENIQIQKALINAPSGLWAKNAIKRKKERQPFIRKDWTELRLQFMLYCIWQKCKGNEDFCKLLLQIPDEVILVEDTETDNGATSLIWGCKNHALHEVRQVKEKAIRESFKAKTKKELHRVINVETNKINDIGEWRGQNNIGKILMICRQSIKEGKEPTIDYDLLRNAQIYLFGKLLQID